MLARLQTCWPQVFPRAQIAASAITTEFGAEHALSTVGVLVRMSGSFMLLSIGVCDCPVPLMMSQQMSRDPSPICNKGSTIPARRVLTEMRSIRLALSSVEGHCKACLFPICADTRW